MEIIVNNEPLVVELEINFQQKGDVGEKPSHTWNNSKLSFENPDGTMGEEVELMPQFSFEIDENMNLIMTKE